MKELKIGSIVYRRNGTPIEITGETKASWILGGPHRWDQSKVKKSAMRKGDDGEHWIQFFVEQQDALDCSYAADHRYRIGSMVQDCRDGVILRQVAALVGYEPK